MRDRHQPWDRVARIQGRCILNCVIPPILYFVLLGCTFFHTALAISIPGSRVHRVIRWLEPSSFLPLEMIVYVAIGPLLMTALVTILQVFWTAKEASLSTSIFKHYCIKIGMLVSYIFAFGLL